MKKKGFTLVELLAVIAILAILILIVLPNVVKLFNKSKKDTFINETKIILREAEKQWIKKSMFQSKEEVYAKCESGNCPKYLDIVSRSDLNYYVKVDATGKIIELYTSDGTYQYRSEVVGLKADDINDAEEITDVNRFVIACDGIDFEHEFADYSEYSSYANKFLVNFNSSGGSVSPANKYIVYNNNYGNLPKPKKTGYTFLGWSKIPSEYQVLDYIESNNTTYSSGQYIDLGIKVTDKIGFDIDFSISNEFNRTESGSNSWGEILGLCDTNPSSGRCTNDLELGTWTGIDSSGYFSFGKNILHSKALAPKLSKNNRIQISFKNKKYNNLDEIATDEFTSNNNLYLFARNWVGGVNAYAKMKLYSLKIYNGDSIIMDLIPCNRISDNEVGLYDIVGNKFLMNKGTGRFKKGKSESPNITSTTKVTSNQEHTLYAIWDHNPTITFNANGGSVNPSTKSYSYNSNYGSLPTPSKNGNTFLGWKEFNLPDEYQEVEYIESNNTTYTSGQYIDTGVKVTEKTGFDVDFSISNNFNKTESGANSWGEVFGVRDSNKNSLELGTWSGIDANGYFSFGKNINDNKFVPSNLSKDSRIRVSMRKKDYINPSGQLTQITTDSFTTSINLYLFARNLNGVNAYAQMKLYSFKIYEGDTLIRDFIPCYRKIDNLVGLYDAVENKFYTNKGAGAFKKGNNKNSFITSSTLITNSNDHSIYAVWGHNPTVTFNASGGSVSPSSKTVNYNNSYGSLPTPTKSGYTFVGWSKYNLPDEYQEVEYVESNGATYSSGQYIDTGVKITEKTGFDIDFSMSSDFNTSQSGTNSWGSAFGVRDSSNNSLELGTWTGRNSTGYFSFGKSINDNKFIPGGLTKDSRVKASMRNKLYTNPSDQSTQSPTDSFTASINLYLFARNWNGINAYSKMKLYSFKIYDGNSIIRDFVPCYRRRDGVIGLYDVVDNKFYTNKGTGSFKKGNNKNSLVTSTTKVISDQNHTLYAIWGSNQYSINYYANPYLVEGTPHMITLSGRKYNKYNGGKALIAYTYNGGYTGPIIVSENADAVAYNTSFDSGRILTSDGTINFDDIDYYYGSHIYWMGGNVNSTAGIVTKKYTSLTNITGAEQLLKDSKVGTIHQNVRFGNTVNLTKNSYVNTYGYFFKGWSKTMTGDVLYTNGQSVKDITSDEFINLYAIYGNGSARIKFNSTCKYNGTTLTGSGSMEDQVITNTKDKMNDNSLNPPNGYKFNGWNTKQDGSGERIANGGSLANIPVSDNETIVLYAQWIPS